MTVHTAPNIKALALKARASWKDIAAGTWSLAYTRAPPPDDFIQRIETAMRALHALRVALTPKRGGIGT